MTELDATLHRRTVLSTFATRLLVVLVVLLGATIVTLQLRITSQSSQTVRSIAAQQDGNTASVQTIKALTRQIESCTTPTGDCYKDSQKRTAGAVGDINKVVVLAAACADKPRQQTEAEIQRCIINRLAAERPTP